MNPTGKQDRAVLQRIARRAMLERGLLPDFSERQVGKSAAALLLESRIGERFDAIVTGASAKGTWVRLLDPPVEGRLVHGFEGIDVGHRVRVQLTHTDVEQGFIDFTRRD